MVNKDDPRLRGLNGQFSKQDPRLRTAQQRIAQFKAKKLREQQIKTEALRLDNEFRNIKTGNINEIITAFNNVPNFIKTQMTYNVQELKDTQQSNINSLQDRIKQSRENEQRYRKKDDSRARVERERAKREGYNEGMQKLQAGILIPLNEITSFANKLGSLAYDQIRK